MMKKYVDLDAVLDVLAKDHAKRTDDQEAEILKVWDEIRRIPKANVVELPCEIGQTVYGIDRRKRIIIEAKVCGFSTHEDLRVIVYCHYNGGIRLGEMNKNIFQFRAEAENKLKQIGKENKK